MSVSTEQRRIDGSRRSTSAWHAETRQLSLEAIAWMGRGRPELADIHHFASCLPLSWWAHKDTHSINGLIDAIEREMERSCPPA